MAEGRIGKLNLSLPPKFYCPVKQRELKSRLFTTKGRQDKKRAAGERQLQHGEKASGRLPPFTHPALFIGIMPGNLNFLFQKYIFLLLLLRFGTHLSTGIVYFLPPVLHPAQRSWKLFLWQDFFR